MKKNSFSEDYIKGFSDSFEATANTAEAMLQSINDVMGIYMDDDLNRYSSRVEELSLMYTTIRSLMSKINDDYFDNLDKMGNNKE